MHPMHNEGKFVVAEIFIRPLKKKIYKYMTSISKKYYIDSLGSMLKTTIHVAELLK